VVEEAKKAVYSELALSRGLDEANKSRYFQKNADGYVISHDVSRQVHFQQFNLLKSYTGLGCFDIIFCRNVLIYFSEQVKQDVLTRIAANLEPDGYLFLSSTESMPMGLDLFEPVRSGQAIFYRKRR
jgi:chemotaxis protein methyltransferase CheR